MPIKLSPKQLLSIVFDDEGNNLYPECYLMNGSQVLETVKLFATIKNELVCYGFKTPEEETRQHWVVFDIHVENNKLFATDYQRM
jgi:hypothetical protein